MRSAQRVIKYFALALAAVLILAIISGVVSLVSLAGFVTWGDGNLGEVDSVWVGEEQINQQVKELDINVKATNVKFVKATDNEPVRVETNNEYITTWVENNRLNVVEKSHGFFGWGGKGELIIHLREGVKFESVKIVVGAGTLNVEDIVAEEVQMELGAGKTYINKIEARRRARIDGGAGVIEIRGGELRNLDLELGAGKSEIKARLRGDTRIDSGVGKLDLDLEGQEEGYKITIDKGIGSVTLNGRKLEDGGIYGKGENLLNIESGVGAVEITTATK